MTTQFKPWWVNEIEGQDRPTVIEQDGYDRLTYWEAKEATGKLAVLSGGGPNGYNDTILSDVHAALYKPKPVADQDSDLVHSQALRQLMETKEYSTLRASTRLDELASALGTLSLGTELIKSLPADYELADEGNRWVEEVRGDGTRAMVLKGPGTGPPASAKLLQGCKDEGDQRRKLRQIVQKTKDKVEQTVEQVRALQGAGVGGALGGESDLSEAIQLAKTLEKNPKLRKIAELAGRMKVLARGKRKSRYRRGPDDVTDVEQGNDLGRLLPSELQAMVTPEFETMALLRFAQRRCLQVKRESREPESKGPIVILLDESGSMRSGREEWARAVTLALMEIAKRDKRGIVISGFTTEITARYADPTKKEVMDFLTRHSSGGGTSFDTALSEGISVLEALGGFEEADVIVITDGDGKISPKVAQDWKGHAELTKTHLYVIYVQTPANSFEEIQDGHARLNHLDKDDAALDLVLSV